MKKIFNIDQILHTAAKKGGTKANTEGQVQALRDEAMQIVKNKGAEAESDARFVKILEELGNLYGNSDSEGNDPAAVAIEHLLESLNPQNYVPGSGVDWEDAQSLLVNVNHTSFKLLFALNQVAISKLPKIINDIKLNNGSPYLNCFDSKVKRWAQDSVGRQAAHAGEYIIVLDSILNSTKIIFTPEDFYSVNAPVVIEYYANDQDKLSEINNFLLTHSLNSYLRGKSVGSGLGKKQLRQYLQDPEDHNKGLPWHLTFYVENGQKHVFAEKLVEDFTKRLAQEDPQAMCVLLTRVNLLKNKMTKSWHASKRTQSVADSSSADDLAGTGKGLAETDFLQSLESEHQQAAINARNLAVVDDSFMSDGPDSLSTQFANKINTLKNGIAEIINRTSPDRNPILYSQFIAINSDFQQAAAKIQQKIDAWKNIYVYEKNMRTVDGRRANRWGASNVDIIFQRPYRYGVSSFPATGQNNIIKVGLILAPSDKTITISREVPGLGVARSETVKTWKLQDVRLEIKWSSMSQIGLTGEEATSFLTQDANAGDTVLHINSGLTFKSNQEVVIASPMRPEPGSENEVGVERGVFISEVAQNQITLKKPLKHNWPVFRKSFIRLVPTESVTEQINEVIEQLSIVDKVADNREITKQDPQIGQALTTLNADWIKEKDQEDLRIIASNIRQELSERLDMFSNISSGMQHDPKKRELSEKRWMADNPEQYNGYLRAKNAVAEYLRRKIMYFNKVLGLTPEGLQCYDTIGYLAVSERLKALKNQEAVTQDPAQKAAIKAQIDEVLNGRDLLKFVLGGQETSGMKEEEISKVKIEQWLRKSIGVLVDTKDIGEILKKSNNQKLYDMIKANVSNIIMKELGSMNDIQIIDLGATFARGSENKRKDRQCKSFQDYLKSKIGDYSSISPEVAAFFSSVCVKSSAGDEATKTSSACSECVKDSNHSLFENIDDWMRYMARKVYIG